MARLVALGFALVSIGVWFWVFDEWWGLVPALLLCLPVGIAFSLLPSLLAGTLRPLLGDVVTTWSFMLVGIAVAIYAVVVLEDAAAALVFLCAAGLFAGGLGLFFIRLDAMLRAARGARS